MNIIYLSSGCSDEKYAELLEKGYTRKLPQAQKYHRLLLEGLATNLNGELTSISAFPVNRTWTKKFCFSREDETINGVHYVYGSFLNAIFLRQWTRRFATMREIKRIYKKNRNCVLICDVLNHSLASAARACGKRYNIPVIGIVTDVPGHTSGARRKTLSFVNRIIASLGSHFAEKDLKKYDAYLLLTEEMNSVVNTRRKPYIVLEGHCDGTMEHSQNLLENKSYPKIAIYAGGIHKEFGIERMVNAFVNGNFNDWELHIYGDGNYQNNLKVLAGQQKNVKYFGVQPNSHVVKEQLKASLLLNPRLTDAEYVKYSFPSKTMECMASGTPLLTTKLPGMPKEYYPYVYFFEDESEEGMLDAFKSVLAKSSDELHKDGARAKEFVIKNKTNFIQSKKLIDFVKSTFKESCDE